MIPGWMAEQKPCEPPRSGGAFALRSLKTLGGVLARLKIQRGRDGQRELPALWKLLLLLVLLVLISAARRPLLLLGAAAIVLGRLCLLSGRMIWDILKSALAAALLGLLIFLPAMLIRPSGAANNLSVVGKIFLSVTAVNCFNRTTQWNHVTGALRQLRVPAVFVFLLDLTLKYIVLLGTVLVGLLSSFSLRAVGRARREYRSVGGVLGVTFLRSVDLSRETWEAMQCRCFTDDYKGLSHMTHTGRKKGSPCR
jgi:cobalt/nickel transport system permease protein